MRDKRWETRDRRWETRVERRETGEGRHEVGEGGVRLGRNSGEMQHKNSRKVTNKIWKTLILNVLDPALFDHLIFAGLSVSSTQ